jgi:ribosomal protein S14
MLKRKSPQEKKTPVKGEPVKKENTTVDTVCSDCGRKRPYSNKSKKLCAVCVKRINQAKIKERKEKVRKKKAESIGVLTKKLDRIFSVFVRLSGTNKSHSTKCFTCDKVLHWREIQCGHFQSRRFYSTRFHELNCKPQCYACNIGLSGNTITIGKNKPIIININ